MAVSHEHGPFIHSQGFHVKLCSVPALNVADETWSSHAQVQTLKEQDWEQVQQASVLASVAQAFESDEGMSDGEGDRITLFSSATQLSPSRQAHAKTPTVMLQEQLDAINEEIRWVCLNSAPGKLGFSEELSSLRKSECSIVRNLTSGLLQEFSVLRLPLIIELSQPGRSVHGVVSALCGGVLWGVPPSSEPLGV